MKHRTIFAGFILLLVALAGIIMFRPHSALAATTYRYLDAQDTGRRPTIQATDDDGNTVNYSYDTTAADDRTSSWGGGSNGISVDLCRPGTGSLGGRTISISGVGNFNNYPGIAGEPQIPSAATCANTGNQPTVIATVVLHLVPAPTGGNGGATFVNAKPLTVVIKRGNTTIGQAATGSATSGSNIVNLGAATITNGGLTPGNYTACIQEIPSFTCKAFTKTNAAANIQLDPVVDPGTTLGKSLITLSGAGVDDPGEGGDDPLECDSSFSLDNPLNWLICPIIGGIQDAVGALDDAITNLLTINTNAYFNTSDPAGIASNFYSAWSGFRNVAMGLLVIIALIMVISTAIQAGPFDAYTVRRVMPRLVTAVILISLSWPLMKFAVDLSNGLGHVVRSLIYAPFSGFKGGLNANIGLAGLLLIGGGTALALLGTFGLLAFALTALIAVLTALMVLVFREMLIVFLVIVAPIAIVATILPNTQRVWQMWSSYFMRALLLFPMFSAFVAVGRAFAQIATTIHPGLLGTIIAFVAYFGPYFMLPTLFRLSGGAIATVAGAAAGATAGMRGGLGNFRKRQTAKRVQDMGNRAQAGNFFKSGSIKGEKSLAGRFNKGIQTATLAGAAGYNVGKWKERVAAARSAHTTAASADVDKSAAARAVLGNDDLLTASLHGNGTEADIRAYLQDTLGQRGDELDQNVAAIVQAKKDVGKEAFDDYAAANLAGTGTGYKSGPADMLETINRVAGGDRTRAARILQSARGQAERAKRVDLYGAGFATSADQMSQLHNGKTNSAAVNEIMTDEALLTKSAYEVGGARNNAFTNMSGAITRRLARAQYLVDSAEKTGNADTLAMAEHVQKQAFAATSTLQDMAGQVAPENAQVIGGLLGQETGKPVHDHTKDQLVPRLDANGKFMIGQDGAPIMTRVPTATKAETWADRIESLEGDTEYKQYKKTYASERSAALAQAASQAAQHQPPIGPNPPPSP